MLTSSRPPPPLLLQLPRGQRLHLKGQTGQDQAQPPGPQGRSQAGVDCLHAQGAAEGPRPLLPMGGAKTSCVGIEKKFLGSQ